MPLKTDTDTSELFAPPLIAAWSRDGRDSATEALMGLARLLGRHAAREYLTGANIAAAVSGDE